MVPLRDWGPRVRIACGHGRFAKFSEELNARCARDHDGRMIALFGSGDFHHVTLALLRRLTTPFNLLLIDKHPDWVRGAPLLHCGTWLAHALRLSSLQRVFHVGGDRDFDNGYRHFAPWRELQNGRITVIPATRVFTRGKWRCVPHEPLRAQPHEPASADHVAEVLGKHQKLLADVPLYISIDKDVLQATEAVTNWDAGHLTLDEVTAVIRAARSLANGRLAGADITGDWSPVRVRGLIRRVLDRVEHEAPSGDVARASEVNARANGRILRALGA